MNFVMRIITLAAKLKLFGGQILKFAGLSIDTSVHLNISKLQINLLNNCRSEET